MVVLTTDYVWRSEDGGRVKNDGRVDGRLLRGYHCEGIWTLRRKMEFRVPNSETTED